MQHLLKSTLISGFAAAICLSSGFGAAAKEIKLTASSSHPPVVPWVATIKNHVVPEAVKRAKKLGHTIKWTEAYAGALYNFKNTLEGIQDGLGDVGWVGTLWEPNKLPLHNVTFYAPFVTDSTTIAADIADAMHKNIPAMKKAFLKYNQVYLGPQTIDQYVLITNFPVTKLSDLKGKKIYGPGAVANWIKGAGGVAVNGGLVVYYNGIKTGIASGGIVPASGIIPFKLQEVAKYITVVGLGGGITGALTMNKNSYDKLPADVKKMFHQLGQEYGALVAKRVAGFSAKSMKVLLPKAGAIVTTLPAAEQKKWADNLPDLAGDWAKAAEKKGLPGKAVLKAWMDGARKAGVKPLRDWDK